MASKIKYAVSATPIFTMEHADAASDVDVIAADVGKTLGGSGDSLCGYANIKGWNTNGTGTVAYNQTGTNMTAGQDAVEIPSLSATKFVFIKHTGYLYSDATTLGDATAVKVKICMEETIEML